MAQEGKYIFTYWNIPAGESIRALMALRGLDFEENFSPSPPQTRKAATCLAMARGK